MFNDLQGVIAEPGGSRDASQTLVLFFKEVVVVGAEGGRLLRTARRDSRSAAARAAARNCAASWPTEPTDARREQSPLPFSPPEPIPKVCLSWSRSEGSGSPERRRAIKIWKGGEKKNQNNKRGENNRDDMQSRRAENCSDRSRSHLRQLLPGVSSCFDNLLAKTLTHGRLFPPPPFLFLLPIIAKKKKKLNSWGRNTCKTFNAVQLNSPATLFFPCNKVAVECIYSICALPWIWTCCAFRDAILQHSVATVAVSTVWLLTPWHQEDATAARWVFFPFWKQSKSKSHFSCLSFYIQIDDKEASECICNMQLVKRSDIRIEISLETLRT